MVCGTGGILVDLLADTAFRLHPLTDADAREMVDELGARGCCAATAARRRPTKPRCATSCCAISALVDGRARRSRSSTSTR